MKNCLIMLVNGYPFIGGEDFLLTELPVISQRFDKIFIFARDVSSRAPVTRPLPEQAEAFGLSQFDDRLQKRGQKLLGCALSLLPGRLDSQERSAARGAAGRAFCEYFELRAADGLRECMKRLEGFDLKGCDNVVIYSYWLFVTARIGVLLKDELLSRGVSAKLISRAHRYDIYEEENTLGYLPMRRALLDGVDEVYACSESGYNYLLKKYPDCKARLGMAMLGSADCGESSHSRSEFFDIVSCSVVTPRKRVGRIASALSLLDSAGLSLRWTHIGDGEELEDVKRMAGELKNIRVRFLGRLPNDEVYEFYKKSSMNLFINVSQNEGLPVSAMEALSFGIPAVVTDVGGSAQAVRDNVSGSVIPADFSDLRLADEIRRFAAMDGEDYLSFCKAARARWDDDFNAEKNYGRFWDTILDTERAQ